MNTKMALALIIGGIAGLVTATLLHTAEAQQQGGSRFWMFPQTNGSGAFLLDTQSGSAKLCHFGRGSLQCDQVSGTP